VSAVKINTFDGIALKWSTNDFFPKKFKNLNTCVIKAGSYENAPGTIVIKTKNESEISHGYEVELIRLLADSLNFTVEFKLFPISTGSVLANKTATGLIKRAYEGQVDFIFALLSLQTARKEHLTETRSLYNDKIILVIPSAILIDPIKKLFIAFELFTWIGILLVIFIACVVITVLNFLPGKYHNFIVGKNIRSEYLKLWDILLGGSQKKLPFRNFSRFLLMMFLLFCLVMRSLYLGSLFNLLKNDIVMKEIKTIDELINLDFSFFIYDSLAPRVKDEKFMKR
jgi:Ligated ion channel L-glutamate- and glycine-binding site